MHNLLFILFMIYDMNAAVYTSVIECTVKIYSIQIIPFRRSRESTIHAKKEIKLIFFKYCEMINNFSK